MYMRINLSYQKCIIENWWFRFGFEIQLISNSIDVYLIRTIPFESPTICVLPWMKSVLIDIVFTVPLLPLHVDCCCIYIQSKYYRHWHSIHRNRWVHKYFRQIIKQDCITFCTIYAKRHTNQTVQMYEKLATAAFRKMPSNQTEKSEHIYQWCI